MGVIKYSNRTTIDGRVIYSLVANEAVGQFKKKDFSFENKHEVERTR